MKSHESLLALFVLFIAAAMLFVITYTPGEMVWMALLLVVTSMVLSAVRPLLGFALIVTEVLGLGFLATGAAFWETWSRELQLASIGKITLYMFVIGVTWLLILQLKRVIRIAEEAEGLITQLKKYEEEIGVLTLNEFLYRAEIALVSMRRRGEKGFIIRVSIDPKDKTYALRALYDGFSHTALQSIRKNYDLVGKVSDTELIILLQNTNAEGCSIVTNRFRNKLQETIRVPGDMYRIEVQALPDEWAEAYKLIAGSPISQSSGRIAGDIAV